MLLVVLQSLNPDYDFMSWSSSSTIAIDIQLDYTNLMHTTSNHIISAANVLDRNLPFHHSDSFSLQFTAINYCTCNSSSSRSSPFRLLNQMMTQLINPLLILKNQLDHDHDQLPERCLTMPEIRRRFYHDCEGGVIMVLFIPSMKLCKDNLHLIFIFILLFFRFLVSRDMERRFTWNGVWWERVGMGGREVMFVW